jgi:pyruvate formate lyase activating enzyme
MHEALLYDTEGGIVKCRLCPHYCAITDGHKGICQVRENRGGKLFTLVYNLPCTRHVDPIEKKPLYHFLPGSRTYSIATVGCNLRCSHCQNWQISQMPRVEGRIVGEEVTPDEVVHEALKDKCKSISYTYTEPTIYMEYALDTAVAAGEKHLLNVFVSNGYMSPDAIRLIGPHLDADNVDLKSFSDKFYREVCGAKLEPVLETLKTLVKQGVWVEVTTLIIPSLNDGKEELRQIAEFMRQELGSHVPWHVSAFHPDYRLKDLPPTQAKALEAAVEIGKEAGLKYVYAGNVPHGRYENTYCPGCGELLIERHGFTVASNMLKDGRCACGQKIEGVWE